MQARIGVYPEEAESTSSTSIGALAAGALLTLWCQNASGGSVLGSAFLVAPGLALTAAHVIEEYRVNHSLYREGTSLFAVPMPPGHPMTWVAHRILTMEGGDVAILELDLHTKIPTDFTLPVFHLGTRMPLPGELVSVLGRVSLDGEGRPAPPTRSTSMGSARLNTITSTGRVIEVYLRGRGALYPDPGLIADIAIFGGMSGGPCFDKRGMVIGVCTSSSLDLARPEEKYGTISFLWRALLERIRPRWPAGFFPLGFRILDLAPAAEANRLVWNAQGWRYRPLEPDAVELAEALKGGHLHGLDTRDGESMGEPSPDAFDR